jgi:RNA-binding protein
VVSLKKLKEQVQQRRADVIIGKHGLSDAVLKEIDRHLHDKEVVKVKALKSAIKVTGLDRRQLAAKVARLLNAVLLDVRGRTFVLYRPKTRRENEGEKRLAGQRYKAQRRASRDSGEKEAWLRRSRSRQTY